MSALPPNSGHSSVQVGCPLSARSEHATTYSAWPPATLANTPWHLRCRPLATLRRSSRSCTQSRSRHRVVVMHKMEWSFAKRDAAAASPQSRSQDRSRRCPFSTSRSARATTSATFQRHGPYRCHRWCQTTKRIASVQLQSCRTRSNKLPLLARCLGALVTKKPQSRGATYPLISPIKRQPPTPPLPQCISADPTCFKPINAAHRISAISESYETSRFRSLDFRPGHHRSRRRDRFVSLPRPIHKARGWGRCFGQGIGRRATSLRSTAAVQLGPRNSHQG